MITVGYQSRPWLALLTLALAACTTTQIPPATDVPATPQTDPPAVEEATALPLGLPQPIQSQPSTEPTLSAEEHLRLAQSATSPLREDHLLKAARAMISQHHLGPAKSILDRLATARMSISLQARRQVLHTHMALLQGNPNRALALLSPLASLQSLGPALLAEMLGLKAKADVALDQRVEAVKTLTQREQYVSSRQEILRNQQEIWSILEGSNRTELLSAKYTNYDPVVLGWLDLALVAMDHSSDAYRRDAEFVNWRRAYPRHPASGDLLSTFTTTPFGAPRIGQIALLLPLASAHGHAAQAVHDGFLALHNANTDPYKPRVRVYDVGAEPTLAPLYYRLAVQDGADFVVGPLGRQAVDFLVSEAELTQPTLLLGNTPLANGFPGQVYQLGLQPEPEAQQVAERAYLDGHRIAAILYPEDAWGQRMYSAFADRWDELGGIVAESQPYRPRESDFSGRIKELLNITGSAARQQRLQAVLKTPLGFQPRRRDDIDFIFLAARVRAGRLLKPQINFYRAHDLPVYSTSHIYSGRLDPVNDTDLNGVIFGDMPWLLIEDGRIGLLRQEVRAAWPNRDPALNRLYALGLDAYNIIPQLVRLKADPSSRYRGVTADIRLAPDGRLVRRLIWARFEDGKPEPLEQSFDYDDMERLGLEDPSQDSIPFRTGQIGGTLSP